MFLLGLAAPTIMGIAATDVLKADIQFSICGKLEREPSQLCHLLTIGGHPQEVLSAD